MGGLAHRVFARHLKTGPIEPGGLEQVCREEIGSSMNPKLGSLGLKPSDIRTVIEQVGSLYERFKTLGADGFAGAEVPLEVEPADAVTLRGAVDAVFSSDTGTRLVDWKTGGLGDPEPQLGFYALLWAMERGEIPGRVEAVSVASGERYEAVPTVAGVQAMAARVGTVVDTLRAGWHAGEDLERTAGPWCRFCPLLDGCTEGVAAQALLGGRPSTEG